MELKHKIKLWANRITEFAYDEKNRRCIVVRNKWQLLWRCMQQPYFKRWRDDVRLKRQLEEVSRIAGIAAQFLWDVIVALVTFIFTVLLLPFGGAGQYA